MGVYELIHALYGQINRGPGNPAVYVQIGGAVVPLRSVRVMPQLNPREPPVVLADVEADLERHGRDG